MIKLATLLAILLLIPNSILSNTQNTENKQNIYTTNNTTNNTSNDPYTLDEKYIKLKENINFGTSAKRIWAIKEITKEKKYFNLIEYILKNEKNHSVIIEAINTCSKLKLKQYAQLIQNKLYLTNELDLYIIECLGKLEYKQIENDIINIIEKKQNKIITLTAIQTLGKIKSHKALTTLYNTFKNNTNYQIQYEIINTIKLINNKNSIPFLTEIINNQNSNPNIKAIAILAIAKCGGKLSSIEQYNNHNNITIATASINALPLINTYNINEKNKIFNLTYNSLKKDNPKIRIAALNSIKQLKLNPTNKQKASNITSYIIFNDENKQVRKKAIETLNLINNNYAKKLWEKELSKQNNHTTQINIIQSLNKLNKQDAIYLLNIAFQNSKSIINKKQIIEQLFNIDSYKAINFINTNIMNNNNIKLPLKLYSMMLIYKANNNPNSIKTLEKELKNPNIHIRRYAYNYLLQINKQKTKNIVFNTLKTENNNDIILHILQLFYQKKITDSLPLLKEKLVKSNNIIIKKESEKLIKYLESLS